MNSVSDRIILLLLSLIPITASGCFGADRSNPVEADVQALYEELGRIIVLEPNGDEQWHAGSQQTIRWNRGNSATEVTLFLSSNDGLSYSELIARGIPNTGSYTWTVPAIPSRKSRIRIASVAGSDISDNVFSIHVKPVPVQVTRRGGEWPVWRNDRIAFMANRAGHYDIYATSISGEQEIQITSGPAEDRYPTLDGKGFYLAFSSDRTGREEIWATSQLWDNNPTQIQITTTGGVQPIWRPIPISNQLAYLAPAPTNSAYSIMYTLAFDALQPSLRLIDHRSRTAANRIRRPTWVIESNQKERVYFQDLDSREPNSIQSLRIDNSFRIPESILLPFNGAAQNPTVSPSGSTLAVSVAGDIWVFPLKDGQLAGNGFQVTFDPAQDDRPDLRSDHDMVFQSDRTGQWEVWRLTIP